MQQNTHTLQILRTTWENVATGASGVTQIVVSDDLGGLTLEQHLTRVLAVMVYGQPERHINFLIVSTVELDRNGRPIA